MDHHDTSGQLSGGGFLKHMIFRCTIMFLILTTLCVFLRLWAKLRTGKRVLGVDDYSMLTAWPQTNSYCHAVFRDSTERPSI
ncbi:unnamed protein product [Aureobasidium pullulans]|nr:unnamed protein product [Aureobasidium pullulans]